MSIPATVRRRRNELVELIESARTSYYSHDKPTISDAEYDKVFQELIEIETQFPELVSADSPTQSVGGEAAGEFGEFEHPSRMWSLDNVFDLSELDAWFARVGDHNFLCELKIDGLAINVVYRNGELETLATRGSGSIGENVTASMEYLTCIPRNLKQLKAQRFPNYWKFAARFIFHWRSLIKST